MRRQFSSRVILSFKHIRRAFIPFLLMRWPKCVKRKMQYCQIIFYWRTAATLNQNFNTHFVPSNKAGHVTARDWSYLLPQHSFALAHAVLARLCFTKSPTRLPIQHFNFSVPLLVRTEKLKGVPLPPLTPIKKRD